MKAVRHPDLKISPHRLIAMATTKCRELWDGSFDHLVTVGSVLLQYSYLSHKKFVHTTHYHYVVKYSNAQQTQPVTGLKGDCCSLVISMLVSACTLKENSLNILSWTQMVISRSFFLSWSGSGVYRWRGSIMARASWEMKWDWSDCTNRSDRFSQMISCNCSTKRSSHLVVSQLMDHYLVSLCCATSGYKATKPALHPLAQIWLV